MNNDNAPQALHTLLPPENLSRTRMPAKDVESESSNAVKRRKTKHISRACNPCRAKCVLSLLLLRSRTTLIGRIGRPDVTDSDQRAVS